MAAAKAQAPAGPRRKHRPRPRLQAAGANEHPLMPALRWAREGLPAIEKIQDYTATVMKQRANRLEAGRRPVHGDQGPPKALQRLFHFPGSGRGEEARSASTWKAPTTARCGPTELAFN